MATNRLLARSAAGVIAASLLGTSIVLAQSLPASRNPSNELDLLDSPAIKDEIARQRESAASAVEALPPGDSRLTPGWTGVQSQLNRLGDDLRFGQHNVATKDGEAAVTLIRQVAGLPEAQRAPLLQHLQALAKDGSPEALNFFGFASESGLFGMRRDDARAAQFYQAAASINYQPALYNLALRSAYGRGGTPVDLAQAAALLKRAAAVGSDASWRVCGMAAFIAVRLGADDAAEVGRGCGSPLAALATEGADGAPLTPLGVERLRRSISTGVDDGYAVLMKLSRQPNNPDPFGYCRYWLLDRYRSTAIAGVANAGASMVQPAQQCVDDVAQRQATAASIGTVQRQRIAAGIAAAIPMERQSLDNMRKSNRFHYAWSVPYLPFKQQDVDLFDKLVTP